MTGIGYQEENGKQRRIAERGLKGYQRYGGVAVYRCSIVHSPQFVRLRIFQLLLSRTSLFLPASLFLPRLSFLLSFAFTSGITYVPSRDDTSH